MTLDDLERLYRPRGRDFNLKFAISRKRCEIAPRLQLITNRKSYTGFDWYRQQWPWMTLSTKIEVFTDFTFVRSGPSCMHCLLSRVPFALAGLSCIECQRTASDGSTDVISLFLLPLYSTPRSEIQSTNSTHFDLLWICLRTTSCTTNRESQANPRLVVHCVSKKTTHPLCYCPYLRQMLNDLNKFHAWPVR